MAPPPLPPLSCVAGSLALSFTGAQPIAEPVTPDAIVPELPEPPPAPDIAAPTAAPAPAVAVAVALTPWAQAAHASGTSR